MTEPRVATSAFNMRMRLRSLRFYDLKRKTKSDWLVEQGNECDWWSLDYNFVSGRHSSGAKRERIIEERRRIAIQPQVRRKLQV